MKTKIIKTNWLSIIPLVSCSLLIACNSGNTNASSGVENNVLGLATNDNKIIKETISNIPNNCVLDDVNIPTVETCFYMPKGKNGPENVNLMIPSFAKNLSVIGIGGGGGGGGATSVGSSMYNGGGNIGSFGTSGNISFNSNIITDKISGLTVYTGGGGGGGGGGQGAQNYQSLQANTGGGNAEFPNWPNGIGETIKDSTGNGCSGGGGGSLGGGGNCYTSEDTQYTENPDLGGGYSGECSVVGGDYRSVGGGGGGGGATIIKDSHKNILFSSNGGDGGDGGSDNDSDGALGGIGGSSVQQVGKLLPQFYHGTYNNGGAPRVCDQEYYNCNASDGGAGFAIVTLSESTVVSTTNNVTLNFVSPSQNNICMLIKDNTDDQDAGKRSIEVACSNNGHAVYIKTLAGVGAEISATDDGSVIHIGNSSNKSLEFNNPLITNIDTVMNERFEYKSVLQEEKFAQSNPEYKTTVVTSDVRYDPTNPTKVVETKILASSGSLCTITHGNISCSSVSGYGFPLPSGGWINECYGSHYDGVTLTAMCGGLEQSQFATPGTTSSCSVEGVSLTCTDGGFKYPLGTSNYEKNLYPSWLSWNFKKDHFGGDILLSAVSGQSGDTSTTLAASGSESYCKVVGVNDFLSCDPYPLPEGSWLQDSSITGAFYDGYNLTVTRSGVGGTPTPIVIAPNSGGTCSSSASGVSCN